MYGLYGIKHHIVEISGDVTDAGQTNEGTREVRTNEPLDVGRLSFAKYYTVVKSVINDLTGTTQDNSRQHTPQCNVATCGTLWHFL